MEKAVEPKPVQLSLTERRHCSHQVRWAEHVTNHHSDHRLNHLYRSVQIILTCTEVSRGWFLIGLSLSSSLLRRVHSASPWVSVPTGPLQLHSAELSCLPPGRHLLLVSHAGISHPASQHLEISSARAKELFPNRGRAATSCSVTV